MPSSPPLRDDPDPAPCPTKTLDDDPAPQSYFKPHSDLAGAIANIIATEKGGRAIGLEGAWGSGKSTVVRHLIERVPENVKVMTFDAWSHEGDPLRRAFLATAIACLNKDWLTDKAKWRAEEERLAGPQHRESVQDPNRPPSLPSESAPQGRLWYPAIACSLLLFPLGLVLFSAALHMSGRAYWVNLLSGLLLLVAPLVLVGLAYRYGHLRATNALRLALGQTPLEPMYTLEYLDRTSLEFQSKFDDLLTNALIDDRKLVIVLDNLDRVSDAFAAKVWSVLRPFLEYGSDAKPWIPRFWVIVPYALAGLNHSSVKASRDRQCADEPAIAANDDAENLSAYLEKRVHLRFRVPAPVLSSWRGYLGDLLADAFEDHTQDEFHNVYRTLSSGSWGLCNPPPRTLKVLVNQIGVEHRLHRCSEIPLSQMAYFANMIRSGVDVASALLEGSLPEPSVSSSLGPRATEGLASLWFGVTPSEALQLLLGQPVGDALQDASGAELSRLSQFTGFWEVLERVGVEQLTSCPAATVSRASRAIMGSELADTIHSNHGGRTVVRAIGDTAGAIDAWSLDDELAAGIPCILKLTGDANLGHRILARLDTVGLTPEAAPAWTLCLVDLLDGVRTAGYEGWCEAGIVVNAPAAVFLAVAETLARTDSEAANWRFVRAGDARALADQIASDIASGALAEAHVAAMRVAGASPGQLDCQKIHAAAGERLQQELAADLIELALLIETFWAPCRYCADSLDTAASVAASGWLHHHFERAFASSDFNLTAWCMLGVIRADPALPAPTAVGRATQGHNRLNETLNTPDGRLVGAFAALVESAATMDAMLRISRESGAALPFVDECVRLRATAPNRSELFPPEVMNDHWDIISAALPAEEYRALVCEIAGGSNLVEIVLSTGIREEDIGLYADLLEWAPEGSARLAEELGSWFSSRTQEEWGKYLAEEDGAVAPQGLRLASAGKWEPGRAMARALVAHAAVAAAGKGASAGVVAGLCAAVQGENERHLLAADLLGFVVESGGILTDQFFNCYGSAMADEGPIKDAVSFVRKSVRPMIQNRHVPGLRWLAEVASKMNLRNVLQPDYEVHELKQAIRDELDGGASDEAHELTVQLAKSLGVGRSRRSKPLPQVSNPEGD